MRFNLYRFIHKPIRGQISSIYIQSGKTAFYDAKQVAALQEETLKLSRFLTNHAMREDTFLRPVLVELDYPALPELDGEHENVENKLKSVLSAIADISVKLETNELSKEDLTELGYDFYLTFGDFAGSYLSHMITEERKIMPFLWSKLNDGQLFEIFKKQDDTVTNQEVIDTIHLMYPYFNLDEAVKLTGLLKKGTGEYFPAMVEEIKKCVEPSLCSKIFQLSGVEEPGVLHGENPSIMFSSPSSPKKAKTHVVDGPSVAFGKH